MDYTDGLKTTYDAIAEDYANDHSNDTWDDDYIDLFLSLLTPGANVLDLGCGPGVEMKRLRTRGMHVHGLDISGKILAIARRLNPDSAFTQADMRTMPFENGSFDGVFAKASLLHIDKKDIALTLNEVRRILVPGGIVHIAVKKKLPGQIDGYVTEHDYDLPYTRFFSYWTLKNLTAVLTAAGFTIEHWIETSSDNWSFTWIKVIARRTR